MTHTRASPSSVVGTVSYGQTTHVIMHDVFWVKFWSTLGGFLTILDHFKKNPQDNVAMRICCMLKSHSTKWDSSVLRILGHLSTTSSCKYVLLVAYVCTRKLWILYWLVIVCFSVYGSCNACMQQSKDMILSKFKTFWMKKVDFIVDTYGIEHCKDCGASQAIF